jgi:hypothetical protein
LPTLSDPLPEGIDYPPKQVVEGNGEPLEKFEKRVAPWAKKGATFLQYL